MLLYYARRINTQLIPLGESLGLKLDDIKTAIMKDKFSQNSVSHYIRSLLHGFVNRM